MLVFLPYSIRWFARDIKGVAWQSAVHRARGWNFNQVRKCESSWRYFLDDNTGQTLKLRRVSARDNGLCKLILIYILALWRRRMPWLAQWG
jgi:hypothetical protein